MKRCVNIDWLEVYALEPIECPHDLDYFIGQGYHASRRDYGTRIYNDVITIHDFTTDYKLIEIRRSPKNHGDKALLPINACHIRLTNRTCYYDNAAQLMTDFLARYNYTFVSIYRVDICLDFIKFDSGDFPAKFLKRYINGAYNKVNQSNLAAHGEDKFNGRDWNSISWGAKSSPVGTKLYNKTKELKEVKDKPYIRQAWFEAGLINDPVNMTIQDSKGIIAKPDIWRLEFSIRSDVKRWVTINTYGDEANKKQSIRNTLDMYTQRYKLLALFASLAQHYFHFKIKEQGRSKYECKDKVLFNFSTSETFYQIEKVASDMPEPTILQRLLNNLNRIRSTIPPQSISVLEELIDIIKDCQLRQVNQSYFDNKELIILKLLISSRIKGLDISREELTKLIEGDKCLPF